RAYASWQRGTNENTNGLLRQLIPKGTDFDDDLAKYVDLINNRPRKRLNWLSPNQVFDRELNSVALGTGI
ncbi:MAG: IS30 family transposase, partial [Francisella sp.]